MPQFVVTQKLSFKQPTIGPKNYVTVGSSGWPETFCRKETDADLREFCGQVKLAELVDNFRTQLELDRQGQCHWTDVTGYLSRIFGMKSDAVPIAIGVGFWAHVVMAERTKGAN